MTLGYRLYTQRSGSAPQAIIYGKGAFVLHMLRMLTLDLQTMKEDRFTNILRDFYRQDPAEWLPDASPAARKIESIRNTVVVFPFVPVTPASCSAAAGRP